MLALGHQENFECQASSSSSSSCCCCCCCCCCGGGGGGGAMFWTIMMARSGVVYNLTVGMGLRVRRREELSTSMRFHC